MTELEKSILSLLQELVRTPSRAGVDSFAPIFGVLTDWFTRQCVPFQLLEDQAKGVVALVCKIRGRRPGASQIVLNATVDTVGFGDRNAWALEPTSAAIDKGWLHGRGSADSKAAVAIFSHLASAFRDRELDDSVSFVFDAYEHTGEFSGIRAFLADQHDPIAGVMIGYPGLRNIGAGARGFWRATINVSGIAAHSGFASHQGANAVSCAALIVREIEGLQDELGLLKSDAFPMTPRITVTGIRGGGEFSVVPDFCQLDVDVRLTPSFSAEVARVRLAGLVGRVEALSKCHIDFRVLETWPPYVLPTDSPLVRVLARAAESELGRRPRAQVTGPSNVGNYLAAHGIQATCGFGATCRNVHAPNEAVAIGSLAPVFRIYQTAVTQMVSTTLESDETAPSDTGSGAGR